jgi:hypothetical protein
MIGCQREVAEKVVGSDAVGVGIFGGLPGSSVDAPLLPMFAQLVADRRG